MQHMDSSVIHEQRQSQRKILKVRALLTLPGAEPVVCRTIDVGGDGLCLAAPDSVRPGSSATICFEIFHAGKASAITVKAKAQYCILSNAEFKVGFRFVNLELSAMASLSRFLHQAG